MIVKTLQSGLTQKVLIEILLVIMLLKYSYNHRIGKVSSGFWDLLMKQTVYSKKRGGGGAPILRK